MLLGTITTLKGTSQSWSKNGRGTTQKPPDINNSRNQSGNMMQQKFSTFPKQVEPNVQHQS